MAHEYTTKSGDTWDWIALKVYGSEVKADWLMQHNPQYIDLTKFDSGFFYPPRNFLRSGAGTFRPGKQVNDGCSEQ